MKAKCSFSSLVSLVKYSAAFVLSALMASTSAHGAFHLWQLAEVYTDSTGNYQFIELVSPISGQNFVDGLDIDVSNVGNTQTHTFTIVGDLPGSTLNRRLLIGTSGIQSVGAP